MCCHFAKSPMDILDDLILGPAKHGHLDRLIEFLEGGHEPTVEMRKFIAKVLREVPKSRLKKGSKGVERSDLTYRDMEIAVFVEVSGGRWFEGWSDQKGRGGVRRGTPDS